jgi:hypothetical protein
MKNNFNYTKSKGAFLRTRVSAGKKTGRRRGARAQMGIITDSVSLRGGRSRFF